MDKIEEKPGCLEFIVVIGFVIAALIIKGITKLFVRKVRVMTKLYDDTVEQVAQK